MDVIAFAIVLVALAAYVAVPLYRLPTQSQEPFAADDARTNAVESALSELELDRATGLLDESEYRRALADLESEPGIPGD